MKTEILKSENPIAMIEQEGTVSIYKWKRVRRLHSLESLEAFKNAVSAKIVFILPFSQAWKELGYSYIWEEPILAMEVTEELELSRESLMSLLPDKKIDIKDISYSKNDLELEQMILKLKQDIEAWDLCQCILSRETIFHLLTLSVDDILAIYKRLLTMRWGYMTYMFNCWNNVYMWASPERHITVQGEEVIKNPIAWTMPKRPDSFYTDLIKFLHDKKEENELSMVTDEELKMIMKITRWWVISGPILREIWAVVHTEFELKWHRKKWFRAIDCLRETLYSPTLVWWPLKSAFEHIARYEGESRWYYGSAFWVIDGDNMDTCIPIRAARIDKQAATISVRSGAWIVSDSDPKSEVNEVHKKANWFSGILWWNTSLNTTSLLSSLSYEQQKNVESVIKQRQSRLSNIYLEDIEWKDLLVPKIVWKKFLLVNNWDDFVYMIAHLIEKMWWVCDIVENAYYENNENFDFTLIWPGPWDINDETDSKMKKVLEITRDLRASWGKVIWICLWHQAICKDMWLEVAHQEKIRQWKQEDVNIFWNKETVAFYNSFSPLMQDDSRVEEYELYDNNRLLYQKTWTTVSVQFHPESIMTLNGFEILKEMILKLL